MTETSGHKNLPVVCDLNNANEQWSGLIFNQTLNLFMPYIVDAKIKNIWRQQTLMPIMCYSANIIYFKV